MEFHLQIRMNPGLYLKDPEQSELGRNIIHNSIRLIYEMGYEEFTFKKLANHIGTTEASVYRYFENKHKLLVYIITWFWTWQEYQLMFHTNNIGEARQKIEILVKLVTLQLQDQFDVQYINKQLLHRVAIAEGDKVYLTKHVTEDNKAKLFKPYKDFCNRAAQIFTEYHSGYMYAHSLASTVVETAHHQIYFKDHLPSLTDFGGVTDIAPVASYLRHLVFAALDSKELA